MCWMRRRIPTSSRRSFSTNLRVYFNQKLYTHNTYTLIYIHIYIEFVLCCVVAELCSWCKHTQNLKNKNEFSSIKHYLFLNYTKNCCDILEKPTYIIKINITNRKIVTVWRDIYINEQCYLSVFWGKKYIKLLLLTKINKQQLNWWKYCS